MRTPHLLIPTLVLTLFVAGCGYKGPLYLSKDKPAAKKPATASSVKPAEPAAQPAVQPAVLP